MRSNLQYYLLFLFGIIFFAGPVSNKIDGRLAGTLLKARATNIEDNSILCGYVIAPKELQNARKWTPSANFLFNERAYQSGIQLSDEVVFDHYKSAVRIHFFILACIEDILCNVTGSITDRTRLYNLLYSVLNTFMLFLFIVWIIREFGKLIGVVSAMLFMYKPIMFEFGQFSIWWIHIIPFVASLFIMSQVFSTANKSVHPKHAVLILILVFFCTITSYEMMPTVMISATLPIVFYSIKHSLNVLHSFKLLCIWSTMILCGFFLAFCFHFYVVAVLEGSWSLAKDHFVHRFFIRTYDFNSGIQHEVNDALKKGLDSSLGSVVSSFISKSKGIYSVNEIKYLVLVMLLFALSYAKPYKRLFKDLIHNITQFRALIIAIIIAFIGAIARVIIFKSHGAQSAHQEFITSSYNVPFKMLVVLLLSTLVVSMWYKLCRLAK